MSFETDDQAILNYLEAKPDASFVELQQQFPEMEAWTLRSIRREFRREHAFADLAPKTIIEASQLDGFSPAAKLALRAGFFNTVNITIEEQRAVKSLFKKAGYSWGVISDGHAPDHDPHAIDVATQVMQAVSIDHLILAGDWFDAHAISKYTLSKDRAARWVDERQLALPVIGKIRAAFADIPVDWIFGNHDTRPERYIDAIAPQLQGLFTLPQLLGIDSLGFNFPEGNRVVIADKLLVIHGTKVRKDAGASAKAEVQDYGMSVVMGHVHRRGLYEVTTTATDIRGDQPLLGVELGCVCNLRPSYLEPEKTANWQHGAAIITAYDGGLVDVEPIRIHRGRAVFRGRLFQSRIKG
jgi:predicted phosphodiesterase